MMSPLKANDLSFISPSPLPIASHQGLKVTARSVEHYNCATPSRDEVCQQNYERRRKQLREEGYRAPNYQPYQLLGEPLILEEKQMILYALGQLDQKELDDLKNSKQEVTSGNTQEENRAEEAPSDAPPPKKYVLRRCTKSQRCLGQEVVHGRKMVNLAKLGHGFFTLIKQEEHARELDAEQEQRVLDEKQKSEWQPAAILDSSEDEDPELARDEDLSLYMSDGDDEKPALKSANTRTEAGRVKSSLQGTLPSFPTPSSPSPGTRQGRRSRRMRQFQESARPYTPGYSNINFDFDDCDNPDMHALFHQLCALNWILEAMMTEPPLAMESITKCWSIKYRELRQNTFCKTSQQRLRKERHMENKWNMFMTHPGAGHLNDSFLELPGMQRGGRRHMSASLSRQMRRMSMQSQQGGAPQRAPSQQSTTTNRTTIYEASPSMLEEETVSTPRGTYRGGATEWETASHITEVDEMKSLTSRTERSASVASERSNSHTQSSAGTRQKAKPTLSEKHLEEREDQEQPVDQVSTWVETTGQKLDPEPDDRPITFHFSKKKKHFKPSFPSKKHTDLTERLRNKFADVTEDKALMLHDQLEALERNKYCRVERKFHLIDCKKNPYISLQLADFREVERAREEESAEEKRRKKKLEDESKWFQELVHLLPRDIWSDRQCAAVMDKLQSMGKIESRKITPQKFLNVLTGLKYWELCAPDIRAAIEFVREKVVGMSVEEFQAWYQLEIADVRRVKSAPPVHR